MALLVLGGACAGSDEPDEVSEPAAHADAGACVGAPSPGAGEDLSSHEIAFVRHQDDRLDLWVATADGDDPVRLTDDGHAEWTPAWSPDGTRLVFACAADQNTQSDLYVMDADGSNRDQLTHTSKDCESSPSWAPDGERIFYAAGACGGATGIWVMESGGEGAHEVVERGDWPALSPDGERLVYNLPRSEESFLDTSLWLSAADGSGATEVGPAEVPAASEATWSPDGSKIAFVVPEGRLDAEDPVAWDENIFVMNADGSDVTRLTTTPGNDHWPPAWSPDGRRLIFSADGTGEATGDLVVVDVASGQRQRFRMDGSYEFFPTWRE